jgi:hypothetical protein
MTPNDRAFLMILALGIIALLVCCNPVHPAYACGYGVC